MGMSEIIKKMKVFLQNEIPTEVQMTDVKTKDGIILSIDELAVGADIFIVDEAGKNPAADGEYIIEDGQTIIVEEGKISEIKPVEDPIEEPASEAEMVEESIVEEKPIEEKPIEEPNVLDVKVKELEDKVNELAEILYELVKKINGEELKTAIKTEMKIEKLSKNETPKINNNYTVNDKIMNLMYNSKK